MKISTPRLELIPCTRDLLEALSRSETEFSEKLGFELAEGWLQFPESIPYALRMVEADPEAEVWGMFVIRHIEAGKIIGTCGYKGAPNADGMVEIGYAVAPGFQGEGIATEASEGLVGRAFDEDSVSMVDAHTLAEKNPSTSVLKKCGFVKIAELHDEEDGDIWHWRLVKKRPAPATG